MYYDFDVVGRLVDILQEMNVDLDSVTLEEAKELTVAVIDDHRRTEQAKGFRRKPSLIAAALALISPLATRWIKPGRSRANGRQV
jgi:hypothetical protein